MSLWGALQQEAKKAIESNDNEKIIAVRRRMNLLNPTFLVPPGEVSDIWKWCLENLGQPFRMWQSADASFYEKLSIESRSLPERARSAFAVWTLTRKHEFAQAAIENFLKVGELYLSKKWYKEHDMIAFSFEIAAALSMKLSTKPPMDFPTIVGKIAVAITSLYSAGVRGPSINSLTDSAARLAEISGSVRNKPVLKRHFSEILDVANRLAEENPLIESYLEPCIRLSLTVKGPEEAGNAKIRMADSLVKQAEAQRTNIGRMALLQQAMKLYSEAGESQKLEQSKLAVRQAMEAAEKKGEFKTITAKSGPIPKERIVGPYLEKLSAKTPTEILEWLARDLSGIPSRRSIDESTRKSISGYAGLMISTMIPFEGTLPKGRLTNDEKKIQFKIDQNLALSCQVYEIGRAEILKALFEKRISQEELIAFLGKSGNISPNSKQLIAIGIGHHFGKQYTASISILVPQVEEALRTFLKGKGGVSAKFTTRDSGLQERMLDDLLRDASSHLDQGLLDLLAVRMTPGPNGGGSNLRNRACHGWLEAERYTAELSWALIDTILKLSVA